MNIAILGTRGIPAGYGGFETFAEKISERLKSEGYDITVYCEDRSEKPLNYSGIKLKYSHFRKSGNPVLFYLESILSAVRRNDVILVAGTGGSPFYLIPLIRNVKIITNIDGIESRRQKWSIVKRLYIAMSEYIAVRCSDIVIADSEGIRRYVLDRYKIDPGKIRRIEYGADINTSISPAVLKKYALRHDDYYLVVARLEPENNIKMIIEGYLAAAPERPLVIIGNLLDNPFVHALRRYRSDKVYFLDGIYDRGELNALRYSCFAYIHGHSVGGTNPSLLEAMASENISLCHDNIFNREVTESQMYYFSNAETMAQAINIVERLDPATRLGKKQLVRNRVKNYYNWDIIAKKYSELLKTIAEGRNFNV